MSERPARRDLERIHGVNAALAVHHARPDDIQRAWVTEDTLGVMGPLLRSLAKRRRAYRVVGAEELARVAGVRHHEGICIEARRRPAPALDDVLGRLGRGATRLVLLDGVDNPHNVGAVLRVAAHFGASALLTLGDEAPRATPAAVRVAQGAAEAVPVVAAGRAETLFPRLAEASLVTLAADSHGGDPLFASPLPERAVFVLGAEGLGLSDASRRAADRTVCIPGTGAVESLNVATAGAVLLAEHWRRHGPSGETA